MNTSKALITVNHIEPERWALPLVDADWYVFCRALYKGIEGEDWEEMYDPYKEMSRAVGVRKRLGGAEGKSLVGHESSQRQEGRSSMIRLAKRTFRKETKRDWSCGKNISQGSNCCAGQSIKVG